MTGSLRPQLGRSLELGDRALEIAEAIQHPPQAVHDVAVDGALSDRLLDHLARAVEVASLLGPGVAEIVQQQGVVGPQVEGAQEVGFGAVPLLGPFERDSPYVEERPAGLLLRARHRPVVLGDRVEPAFARAVQVPQRHQRVGALRRGVGHRLQHRDGFVVALEPAQVGGRPEPRLPGVGRPGIDPLVGGDRVLPMPAPFEHAPEQELGGREIGTQGDGQPGVDRGRLQLAFPPQHAGDAEQSLGQTRLGIRHEAFRHPRLLRGRGRPRHHRVVRVLLQRPAVELRGLVRASAALEEVAVGQMPAHLPARRVVLDQRPIGGLRPVAVRGQIVDQGAVVAPQVGQGRAFGEPAQRLGGRLESIAAGLGPGLDEGSRHAADPLSGRLVRVLPRGFEITPARGGDGHHDVAQAVARLAPPYLRGQLQSGIQPPVGDEGGQGLELEPFVGRVAGEGPAEEIRRGGGVAVAPGRAPGQVAAKRRDLDGAVGRFGGGGRLALARPVGRADRRARDQRGEAAGHQRRRGAPGAAPGRGWIAGGHLGSSRLRPLPRRASRRSVTCSGSWGRRRPRAPPS